MAKKFTHNSKCKLVAAAIADNMDYIKASKSYLSQAELKNKKFGKSYNVYLPDPGKVVNGIEADHDSLEEVEVSIYMDNFNTSIELDVWQEMNDIESFTEEIAKPRGVKLARTEQKKIVDHNVFKSAQAIVGDCDFKTLSDAVDALGELAVSGKIVDFQAPTVLGRIAASGMAKFLPADTMKEIYTERYIGEYAGASHVELPVLPIITTPASQAATITLVDRTAAPGTGFEPVRKLATNAGVNGLAYKAEGLKIVDPSGMATDQDYIIIADAEGNIPEIRISKVVTNAKGESYVSEVGNPNAWVENDVDELTLTPILANSTKYWVGQVRTEDCLAYDSYQFGNLPGSDNEGVGTVGGTTVKMSQYGEGKNLTKLVRLDAPFAAGLIEHRNSVTVYIPKN